jgi:hypothetical protein
MTVEPGNRCADTTENDAMRDILPDLVLIETLIGCTMQFWELLVQTVSDRLCLTLIDIGGQTDAQNGNDSRCQGNLRIEMDRVIGTIG